MVRIFSPARTAPVTTTPPPRFYRFGNLPPRRDDLDRVRRAAQKGPLTKQSLIERAGLSQTRTLCAIDALIATGELTYDTEAKLFASSKPG
jgi:hypothetical protein